MKRRGKVEIIAGDLDSLSPEDRDKLLDKVKEKLIERLKAKGNESPEDDADTEQKSEETPEKNQEDSKEKDDSTEETDSGEEKPEESEKSEESGEDKRVIKLTASNATGKGTKDRDLMTDVGGSGKHKIKPYMKPPRDDAKKRFNYDKVRKENRGDYDDVHGDPDLKLSSRRGKKVR